MIQTGDIRGIPVLCCEGKKEGKEEGKRKLGCYREQWIKEKEEERRACACDRGFIAQTLYNV